MRYFGVPACPYCKKRVNLIRTWSLKRQGEYQCPRCGGISNIYLSPLIYVFALLAVFAGGAVYFFHKFVLDDISLSTVLQVLIPFAVFFLLSLFMVYLAKPVIKKVSRAEMERKKRGKRSFEDHRPQAPAGQPMFYDSDEYLPQVDYRTGPLPQMEDDRDMKVLPPAPRRTEYSEEMQKTAVVEVPRNAAPAPRPAQRTSVVDPVSRPVQRAPVEDPAPRSAQRTSGEDPAPRRRTAPSAQAQRPSAPTAQGRQVVRPESAQPQRPSRVVTGVEIPGKGDDFFAKYDDPEYVKRRLQELKEGRKEQ